MCRAQTPSEALLASGSGRREGHEGDQGPLRVEPGPLLVARRATGISAKPDVEDRRKDRPHGVVSRRSPSRARSFRPSQPTAQV